MLEHFWNIKPNRSKAIMLAKRQLVEFVHDAITLEGINYTLPEVQTLLDGVTIGGHNVQEQQITLNQAKAWKRIFFLVEQDRFKVTVEMACELHAIAGEQEALELGRFRSGGVTIAGTDYHPPEANGLLERFAVMVDDVKGQTDIYDRAITVFLTMARTQFFYDVNKRMGRFMMNGLLLVNGFPAINLPAKRQLEFNQLMLEFYASNNRKPMNTFLRSCMDPKCIQIMNEE